MKLRGSNELIFVGAAVLIALLIIATQILVLPLTPTGKAISNVTLNPVHDADIRWVGIQPPEITVNPNTPALRVENFSWIHQTLGELHEIRKAYLKFDLTGYCSLSSATLKLTKTSGSSNNYCPELYKIDDYETLGEEDWDPSNPRFIANLPCNDNVNVDVTSFISLNTTNAFMIKGEYITDYTSYGSVESLNKPELELVLADSVPCAPTGVNAIPGPNVGEITLNWDPSTGAETYRIIWRKYPDNPTGEYFETTETTYTHFIPESETAPYEYVVKACNSNGCSSASYPVVKQNPKISANADGPYEATAGENILLNASGQYLDNVYLGGHTYSWDITGNANCSPSTSQEKNPTITCSEGTATAALTITANYNNDQATDTADINITGTGDLPVPQITAGPGPFIGSITLSWNAITGADKYKLNWSAGAQSNEWVAYSTSYNHAQNHSTPPVGGILNYYKVQACDQDNLHCSDYSNEVSEYPRLGTDAGGPYAGTPNQAITLNGTALYPAGTPTYSWSITTNNADCTLTNQTTQNPTITCATTGSNTRVELTVTAANGTATDPVIISIGDSSCREEGQSCQSDSDCCSPLTCSDSICVSPPDANPPTVNITYPSNNQTVNGTENITVEASDESGIKNVKFYVDNLLKVTDNSSPYEYNWNTLQESNASHVIKVIAEDAAGNTAETQITVTVNNVSGPECGNGIKETGEGCDDGNLINGDGCSSNCKIETSNPECGNNLLETGEECDDNNLVNGDGCSSDCKIESVSSECGNGIIEAGEQCEINEDCGFYATGRCNFAERKYQTREVPCSNCSCLTGNWINSTSSDYCTKCSHCGDGEPNCGETESTCSTDFGGPDNNAPEKPKELDVVRTTENSITVDWQPNTEPDLEKYIIYYQKSSGGTVQEKTALKNEVSLTLSGLQSNTRYLIWITAVDSAENESQASDEVSARTKQEESIVIPVPGSLTSKLKEGKVVLEWHHTSPLPDYYIIQRKKEGESFSQIDSTTENSFSDEEVKQGEKYFYRIAGFKNGKTSSYSNETEIEVKKEKECPTEKDGFCDEECTNDPDCEADLVLWGIGGAIVVVSVALAYIIFNFDV